MLLIFKPLSAATPPIVLLDAAVHAVLAGVGHIGVRVLNGWSCYLRLKVVLVVGWCVEV